MLTPRKIPSRPMRPKHQPNGERERHPQALKPLAVAPNYARCGAGVAAPKGERADPRGERAHKTALAELGCMACRRLFPYLVPGPVELHHLRGGGWGRGDYTTLIPICFPHHRGDVGIHTLGTKAWERRFGFSQADLLMDALEILNGK